MFARRCIEWINAMSSTCFDKCGKRLETHEPLSPYFCAT